MSLTNFLVLSVGGFVLLHYWLIPRLDRRARMDTSPASIPLYGALAALQLFRTISVFAVFVSTALTLAVTASQLIGGTSSTTLGAAIGTIQTLRGVLTSISPAWSATVAVLCMLALVLLARKAGRAKAALAFNAVFKREFDRIAHELREGIAEDLPRDAEMEAIDEQIARGQQLFAEAEAAAGTDDRDQLRKALEFLYAHRFAADVRRRMMLQVDPEQILTPPPTTAFERVQLFFVSRGLLTSMKLGSRLVAFASLLLLVPSLIGIQSSAVAQRLDERLVSLAELQVQASVREAEEAWQQAQSSAAAAPVASDLDDDEVLDALSREFEDAFASTRAWQAVPRARISLRTATVRERILRVRADHAPASVELVPGTTTSDDLTRAQIATLQDFQQSHARPGPRTGIGRRIRADLSRLRSERPEAWSQMRNAVRSAGASFQHAASTDDFGRFLTSRVVGSVLEGIPGDDAFAQMARDLTDEMTSDAIERFYRGKSLEFMTTLAHGEPLPSAARAVANESRPFWTPSQSSRFDAYVRERAVPPSALDTHPPSLAPRSAITRSDVDAARKAIMELNTRGRTATTDALATFDDWFPAQQGRDLSTERAVVTRHIEDATAPLDPPSIPSSGGSGGSGLGGGGGSSSSGPGGRPAATPRVQPVNSPARTSFAARSFARARSFSGLRGFSRIGGVLIGNDPSPASPQSLDFRDIRWEQSAAATTLVLSRHDRREFRLGPYHPAVVHQALAYAADGRPVTVTMVTASPLLELKILLHPALLDSPLGCRAIEIDRFVDQYTGRTPQRAAAEAQVSSQQDLYAVAWAMRFNSVMNVVRNQISPDDRELLLSIQEQATDTLGDAEVLRGAASAVAEPAWLGNASLSPVMDKREFYDADLVKDIKACVTAASGSLDRVKSCLQARFTANADNHLSAKTRWYAPPPEHQFWSGVREQPFDLDENLQFLRASSTPAPHSRLWPFEFMLQVAFTSSPAFLPAGQSAEDYTDDTPWEFPQLKSYLNDTVARGVADSKSQDILEKMRDFVVLQRLFRVALAERMGPHFPIERLEELARATAPRVASARTPRWNPRPGLQESILARQLSSIEGELAQEGATGSAALTTINRCVARIRAADSPELIPATLWAADCGQRLRTPESASARAQRLVDAADQLMARTKQARDLRRALAVGRDDEQMRRGGTCPAM